jgi:PAS domain-containing protein
VAGSPPNSTLPRVTKRIHPEDRAKAERTLDRAITEKSDYESEFRLLLPDGSVKHIHTVGHPVFKASGDLVQFVGSQTDITERKQAEDKIRQSEMELRQVLDFAPRYVAVLGPDRDRTRLYANQTMLDYSSANPRTYGCEIRKFANIAILVLY